MTIGTTAPDLSTEAEDPARPQVDRAQHLNLELLHLSRTMQVVKNNLAVEAGVPWATYMLLFHLIAGGPRRSSALAEVACTDPSTVSRQVDVLVRLGLVERQADPADGRASLLVATAEGVATQARMRGGRDRMLADVVHDWSDQDVHELTRLMSRLNSSLLEHMPSIVSTVQRRAASEPTHLDTKDLA